MKKEVVGLLIVAMLSLSSDVLAQELPMRVKGGHQLGETAEQFFAEGHEKNVRVLLGWYGGRLGVQRVRLVERLRRGSLAFLKQGS